MPSAGEQLRDALAKTMAIAGAVGDASKEVKQRRADTPLTPEIPEREVPVAGGDFGAAQS